MTMYTDLSNYSDVVKLHYGALKIELLVSHGDISIIAFTPTSNLRDVALQSNFSPNASGKMLKSGEKKSYLKRSNYATYDDASSHLHGNL